MAGRGWAREEPRPARKRPSDGGTSGEKLGKRCCETEEPCRAPGKIFQRREGRQAPRVSWGRGKGTGKGVRGENDMEKKKKKKQKAR